MAWFSRVDGMTPLIWFDWAWLEFGVENGGTRMLFVAVRRSLGRIAVDMGLMVEVARRLRSLDRWEGRARLSGRLETLAREIDENAHPCDRSS